MPADPSDHGVGSHAGGQSSDRALSHADRGDVTGGHDELLYVYERAVAARDLGETWGAELVGHWERALTRYARPYRIGRA
jgi:hypothetical protein